MAKSVGRCWLEVQEYGDKRDSTRLAAKGDRKRCCATGKPSSPFLGLATALQHHSSSKPEVRLLQNPPAPRSSEAPALSRTAAPPLDSHQVRPFLRPGLHLRFSSSYGQSIQAAIPENTALARETKSAA
ncbi:hypothetical protein T069G_07005 [Trichoderma breve]|uniref:Uncharacterized protein n=1 Tax=Trichoderma breve TaxID=2034170 RepID=A0A9W9E4G7_9HYPO|nr:hypothetical protein T069G_07005 [Trichoderma breve]KAJ4858738.1 hypothetical protein T069G_07005 [Trichoderma breve]